MTEFTKYVLDFYGENGIYPLSKNGNPLRAADVAELLPTLGTVQSTIGPPWGGGDTTDRETLRRIAEHNGFVEV